MKTYETIISDAAADLARRLRQGQDVNLWAIATNAERNGSIYIGTDCPEFGARLIRPSDNGASTYARWSAVPYSAQPDILWRACRRDPILPIHAESAAA